MNAKRFVFYVPEATAIEPANGWCITDSWWIVHPQFGLAFYEWGSEEPSPQCNDNRVLVERMTRNGHMYAGHTVKRVPAVFTTHAAHELRRLRERAANTKAQP